MTHIFVYGTLKKDGVFNYALPKHGFVTNARLPGYVMWNVGMYPGITKGFGAVYGELYLCNRRIRNRLDEIEGEGHLYKRTPVSLETQDGRKISAETYVLMQDPLKTNLDYIPSGIWEIKKKGD